MPLPTLPSAVISTDAEGESGSGRNQAWLSRKLRTGSSRNFLSCQNSELMGWAARLQRLQRLCRRRVGGPRSQVTNYALLSSRVRLSRSPDYGFVKLVNILNGVDRMWMERGSPGGILTNDMAQSDHGGKVAKDGMEGYCAGIS